MEWSRSVFNAQSAVTGIYQGEEKKKSFFFFWGGGVNFSQGACTNNLHMVCIVRLK